MLILSWRSSNFLHNLYDILVVQQMLDTDLLRLMLDGRTPHQGAGIIKLSLGPTTNRTISSDDLLFEFLSDGTMQLVTEILDGRMLVM